MNIWITYIILFPIIIYIISIIVYIVGNLITKNVTINTSLPSISIIVAVKNGENSLPNILNDLINQNYNGEYECIIVDDQSNDQTANIIKDFEIQNKKIRYVSSKEGNSELLFKKRALDAGIMQAKFDVLLFTDVDCRVKSGWAQSMGEYLKDNVDYIIGFSKISSANNLISIFQKIDLTMLHSTGRATSHLNVPFASIGQNQCYRKKLYNQIGFLELKDSIQGDDTLFMQLCKKNNANIIYNDSPSSIVESRKEIKILPFIKQRIRWAGDAKIMWKYNKLFFSIICATFLTNLLILTLPIILHNYGENLKLWYVLVIAKFIVELILFIIGSIKLKASINIIMFIYWYIVEIPYIVFMGIASFFIRFVGWKGQKVTP